MLLIHILVKTWSVVVKPAHWGWGRREEMLLLDGTLQMPSAADAGS